MQKPFLKKVLPGFREIFVVIFFSSWGAAQDSGQDPTDRVREVLRVSGDLSLRPVLSEFSALFADEMEALGKLVEVELDLAPGLKVWERAEARASETDVWIFMTPQQIEVLAKKSLILPETARTLASDSLAVVTAWPVVGSNTIPPWQPLAEKRWKRLAVANYRSSPSGVAGVRVLKAAGLWDKLDYRIEFRPDSDEVLMDVLRAEVDAGILYRSESRRLLQKNSHTIYELTAADGEFVICAAVDSDSPRVSLAKSFNDHLASKTEIWKKFGYDTVDVKN